MSKGSIGASALAAFVGAEGYVVRGGLRIRVKVTDAVSEFGRVRLEVEPIAGTGRVRVEADGFVRADETRVE